jgi:polyketide synthase-associated protein
MDYNYTKAYYEGPRPLEFRLVEIFNQEPLDPTPELLEKNPKMGRVDVNGKRGQTLGWVEDEGTYLVETFDGEVVAITEDHLREYEPPPVEEGGFDLAFPGTQPRWEEFPSEIAEILLEKQYCVIQMASRPVDRKSASRTAELLDRWSRIMPEFEQSYMGRSPFGKKVLWTDDDVPGENLTDGLAMANRQLTTVSMALMPVCTSLGFVGMSRTNGMVHTNCAHREEEEELLAQGGTSEGTVVEAKEVQHHLSFSQRRKLCMMYFVQGGGGTLTLHPANRVSQDITILCQENQLVVFRHDLLDYTFAPSEGQLALQSWILREAQMGENSMAVNDAVIALANEFESIPRAPAYIGFSESVNCMSVACRLGGDSDTAYEMWTMMEGGSDCIITIPQTRWDMDPYYTDDAVNNAGKAYVRHAGMLSYEQMSSFDNKFFGMSDEEAQVMEPPARNYIEVGYDALYRAGWTRGKMRGVEMYHTIGYSVGDLQGQACRGLYGITPGLNETTNGGAICCRLQYIFGMRGPSNCVETACSSALSATCVMHNFMRPQPKAAPQFSQWRQMEYGLVGGSNAQFDPFGMIGFCNAHMLSPNGRCKTFDASGDGFIRGEGVGSMYYKISRSEDVSKLAMLCSTCANEDGRSASLTAPNGPSQQECIRISLREAGIPPLEIQIQELHGTGTALGDPIEVGALRATMMTCDGEVRESPLVKSSAKSNLGHTEIPAGIIGIMKCTLMGIYALAAPNVHLRLLNPHIDVRNYPVLFCDENMDQGNNVGYHGVSSFGFSGCNARGDIWCRCLEGPRNTQPGKVHLDFGPARIFVTSCLLKGILPPEAGEKDPRLEDLDAYQGNFMAGMPIDPDSKLFIRGSFNGWSSMEPMEWMEDRGMHGFAFALGETRVEQFQLVLDKNTNFTIFPSSKMAGAEAPILGPGEAPAGHCWAVDGRSQGVTEGSVYLVLLRWDESTRTKVLEWQPTTDPVLLEQVRGRSFLHSYSVMGSWNLSRPMKMQPAFNVEPGLYKFEFKNGTQGYEDFWFQRDGDPLQAIYPSRAARLEDQGVPVCGPDQRGEGKHWRIIAAAGEQVNLELRVRDGRISVSVVPAKLRFGPKLGVDAWQAVTWSNEQESGGRQTYYVTASWNGWGFTPMQPDPTGADGVFVLPVHFLATRMEAFQIAINEDLGRTIHPEMQMADQGFSPAVGPDARGKDLNWALFAEAAADAVIRLDLSKGDRRQAVTWEFVGTGPGRHLEMVDGKIVTLGGSEVR